MNIKKSTQYQETIGEINELDSLTVPDQSMSVQEMLLNHTRGIPQAFYDEEIEWFEEGLDLTEIDMRRQELSRTIEEKQREIQRITQAQKDAQKKKDTEQNQQNIDSSQ